MLTHIIKPSPRPVAGLDEIVLSDGTRLGVRPIEPGDRDSFAALFDALSPESRRRRFLSPKPALTAGELKYLTDVDHVNHEAIAAIDETSGTIVGVSRYAAYRPGAGVAEVAFEVADAVQGRGIGAALAGWFGARARTASSASSQPPCGTTCRPGGFCDGSASALDRAPAANSRSSSSWRRSALRPPPRGGATDRGPRGSTARCAPRNGRPSGDKCFTARWVACGRPVDEGGRPVAEGAASVVWGMTLPDDGGRGTAFVSQLAAARAAVDADPLRRAPHAVLITVDMPEGNQSQALCEFESYRSRLDARVELEPTAALRAPLPG